MEYNNSDLNHVEYKDISGTSHNVLVRKLHGFVYLYIFWYYEFLKKNIEMFPYQCTVHASYESYNTLLLSTPIIIKDM